MPKIEDASPWQCQVLEQVATAVGVQPTYTGAKDDHYKFVDGSIFGYVKLFSARARTNPASGVKVIVEVKFWSQIRDGLQSGNDWYGKPSRHLIFAAGDPSAVGECADLLKAARQQRSRT
jgi:hypothetical protein